MTRKLVSSCRDVITAYDHHQVSARKMKLNTIATRSIRTILQKGKITNIKNKKWKRYSVQEIQNVEEKWLFYWTHTWKIVIKIY